MASTFCAESCRKKPLINIYGPESSDIMRHDSVGTAEPIYNGFQSVMTAPYNFWSKHTQYAFESKLPLVRQDEVSTSSNYEFLIDDFDHEKTSSGQMAFLNQLLEDADDKNVFENNNFSYNSLSEKFCLDDESIGQLAIKLADLALEVDLPVQQPHEEPSVKMNFAESNRMYQSLPKNFSDLNPTNVRMNTGKRNQSINHCKKKRFPNNKAVPPKGFMQSVNDIRQEYHPMLNHKFKSTPRRLSGAPFWMDRAKSDGSNSSNSSVHKESINYPSSDLMKYKLFRKPSDSEDDNVLSPQPLRRGRKAHSVSSSSSGGRAKYSECVLCKTNGETPAMYRSHVLKDEKGRTVCQVLQRYVCPLCGATGTSAHTVKYCPKNENPPQVATMTTLKSMRSSTGRKRYGPCSGHIRPVPFGVRQNPLPA